MSDVHSLDLNLLRVLDALFREGSATAAARRLGVTQSAVSHALGRLRDTVGDPLLVRSGRGLVPTPRGEALREPVRHALGLLTEALTPATFTPRAATGTVTVACPDYTGILLGTGIARRLGAEAPGIELVLAAAVPDTVDTLASGRADLVIGPPGLEGDGLYQQRLFDDSFSCVLARTHPLADAPWDLDLFCGLRHVLIAPRGGPGGPVDARLEALGRKRQVCVRVASFVAAAHVVAGSDLVLTMPTRLAVLLAPALDLLLRTPPAPLEVPSFALAQFWHARRHHDPLHRWVRALVADAARALHGSCTEAATEGH